VASANVVSRVFIGSVIYAVSSLLRKRCSFTRIPTRKTSECFLCSKRHSTCMHFTAIKCIVCVANVYGCI